MVAPGQVRAGKACVEIGTDDKLAAGLKKASRRLKAFGAQVGAIGARLAKVGAVVAGAMFGAGKVFAKMGDDVAKMARRTGFSVEALSELQYVASQSGTSIDALENALRRMQRTIYDAERGLSTAVDGLADLGLTLKDLQGITPEQQFRKMAEALSRVEDPTRRAGIAMTLFGRSGTAMLPMIAQGAAGIEALQQKARKLGLTMSKEDTAAAEVFTDQLDTLWRVMKMGVFRMGASLVPLLSELAEKVQKNVVAVMEWLKENRDLVITIAKIALYVGAAGVALMVIGKTIGLVGAALGILAVAAKAAFAALTFLAAHPVILALGVLTVTIGALAFAMRDFGREVAKVSDRMSNLREKGDELRREDGLRMKRLGQLAEKERLNSAEMDEASSLIAILTSRYGDLGASLDKATGKLTGFTAAQAKLTEQMRKFELGELDREIRAIGRNIEALDREMESIGESWFAARGEWARKKLGGRGGLAQLGERQRAQYERLYKAQARAKRIRIGAEVAEEPEARLIVGAMQKRAAAALAAKEVQWSKRISQLKLEAIEDERRRAMIAIQDRYHYEFGQAELSARKIAHLHEAMDLEITNTRRRFDKQAADEARQAAEERGRQEGSVEYDIARLRIETRKSGKAKEMALLKLEQTRELAEAKKHGWDLERLKVKHELERKLVGGRDGIAAAARGTFRTMGGHIQAMLSGSGAADRTAIATEGIKKDTATLVRNAQRGGLAFA